MLTPITLCPEPDAKSIIQSSLGHPPPCHLLYCHVFLPANTTVTPRYSKQRCARCTVELGECWGEWNFTQLRAQAGDWLQHHLSMARSLQITAIQAAPAPSLFKPAKSATCFKQPRCLESRSNRSVLCSSQGNMMLLMMQSNLRLPR